LLFPDAQRFGRQIRCSIPTSVLVVNSAQFCPHLHLNYAILALLPAVPLFPLNRAIPPSRPTKPLKRANKPDRIGRSFELGSHVTDSSEAHPEKQDLQITSIDEGM
jgi:hypothetical protein